MDSGIMSAFDETTRVMSLVSKQTLPQQQQQHTPHLVSPPKQPGGIQNGQSVGGVRIPPSVPDAYATRTVNDVLREWLNSIPISSNYAALCQLREPEARYKERIRKVLPTSSKDMADVIEVRADFFDKSPQSLVVRVEAITPHSGQTWHSTHRD
jgi:hypothetical protein